MANEKVETKKNGTNGATKDATKETATRKGLTVEQLQGMGKKGHLVLLARLCYALGSIPKDEKDPKSTFLGTEWKGREAKKVAGTFYQKVGPKGAILTLDEKSKEITDACALAKLAQKDVQDQKWSVNVQKFFDNIISITVVGTGVRTRNYGIAADLKF